jgi:hypothetical protein
MQRRHFELIAGVLNEQWTMGSAEERELIGAIARKFERELRGENPRFDAGRFHAAVTKDIPTRRSA